MVGTDNEILNKTSSATIRTKAQNTPLEPIFVCHPISSILMIPYHPTSYGPHVISHHPRQSHGAV